ncbi:uncharacterized protein LOC127802105 [Diospyros lotus]|uniref:uncharacterized protein LOC127802105 n=1 Tax=Diospyros lotus TaxID=55363 RepID=UPI002255DE06|nr:uncharacterized protein LOC127802105 [Diospyros lotus]
MENPDLSSSSSRFNSVVDDGSSPFFLHHLNSPSLLLVSQPLTGNNYVSWSCAMLIALSVKNKLGFINGTIPRPTPGDVSLLNAWVRNNKMVISWILNSISKEISASVIYFESAQDIWIDLMEQYQQSNGPRIFQLRRELVNLSQGSMFVSAYFTKLKTIWDELSNFRPTCSCASCSCGGIRALADHYQMEYIISFFMGLNESFSQDVWLSKMIDRGRLHEGLYVLDAESLTNHVNSVNVAQLLEDTSFLSSKPIVVPMVPNIKLSSDEGDLLEDVPAYRRLIGRLLYLTISRPDIAFVVHKLSQYVSKPRKSHLDAAQHLLQYLKASPGQVHKLVNLFTKPLPISQLQSLLAKMAMLDVQ